MQKNQLVEFMKSLGYNTYFYIGYCADEEQRYKKRDLSILKEIYPLVFGGGTGRRYFGMGKNPANI